jgi:putative Se/S carrier protein
MAEMPASYVVLLVFSTSQALRIEKLLSKGGVPCRLVPLPPNLTSDTGVCIRINSVDRDLADQILQANGASVDGIHDLT